MNTKEVATKFEMSQAKALRLLRKIADGESRDKRFIYDPERKEVRISDGSVFTYSPMDVDEKAMTRNRPKHYIWFCS